MRTILVLGGSYLQSHFISTALQYPCKVFVVDQNEMCYAAKNNLGEFVHHDFADIKGIIQFCNANDISSVIAPVNEFGNLIAARISDKLNFRYNPLQVVERSSNKNIWGKLKHVRINKVKSYSEDKLEAISYPVIVKPAVSSSSKGASLVKTQASLKDAIHYAKNSGRTPEIRIEEYIQGDQFSLETISFNRRHYLIAVIEEHLSTEPYFFERTDIFDLSSQKEMAIFFFTHSLN